MSENDMDYNEAPKSANITFFYKHDNFLSKWIRGILENDLNIFLQTRQFHIEIDTRNL